MKSARVVRSLTRSYVLCFAYLRSHMRYAFPHRSTAVPFRIAIGLAFAVSAGLMLWGVGTPFASESTVTLEERVAAKGVREAEIGPPRQI